MFSEIKTFFYNYIVGVGVCAIQMVKFKWHPIISNKLFSVYLLIIIFFVN